MRREKGKYFVTIVRGNEVKKSDEGWQNRQAKVKTNAFANRTDAAIRSGATHR